MLEPSRAFGSHKQYRCRTAALFSAYCNSGMVMGGVDDARCCGAVTASTTQVHVAETVQLPSSAVGQETSV